LNFIFGYFDNRTGNHLQRLLQSCELGCQSQVHFFVVVVVVAVDFVVDVVVVVVDEFVDVVVLQCTKIGWNRILLSGSGDIWKGLELSDETERTVAQSGRPICGRSC
jgi:hypothetical protein